MQLAGAPGQDGDILRSHATLATSGHQINQVTPSSIQHLFCCSASNIDMSMGRLGPGLMHAGSYRRPRAPSGTCAPRERSRVHRHTTSSTPLPRATLPRGYNAVPPDSLALNNCCRHVDATWFMLRASMHQPQTLFPCPGPQWMSPTAQSSAVPH